MTKFTELSSKEMNSTIGGSIIEGIITGIIANVIYDFLTPEVKLTKIEPKTPVKLQLHKTPNIIL